MNRLQYRQFQQIHGGAYNENKVHLTNNLSSLNIWKLNSLEIKFSTVQISIRILHVIYNKLNTFSHRFKFYFSFFKPKRVSSTWLLWQVAISLYLRKNSPAVRDTLQLFFSFRCKWSAYPKLPRHILLFLHDYTNIIIHIFSL